jgi:hypothetical protein
MNVNLSIFCKKTCWNRKRRGRYTNNLQIRSDFPISSETTYSPKYIIVDDIKTFKSYQIIFARYIYRD